MPWLAAGDWSSPGSLSLLLAAGSAAFVTAVRRRHAAPWLVGAAMVALLAAVASRSYEFDLVGWHGFMHGAPMLRLVEGAPVPPEDPAFAGGTLRYPWVEQWIMAGAARATGVNPNLLTIGFEILMYAALLAAGGWLASTVTRDRETIGLAVFVTGYGIALLHGWPLRDAVLWTFSSQVLETRIIPLDKFANISAMPVGYVAMVCSAAASLALAGRALPLGRAAAIVATSTLAAALFHPLSWTGILAFQSVVIAVRSIAGATEGRRHALWIAVAVAAPSLAALPYLRMIGASESSDGWTGLSTATDLLLSKSFDLAAFLLPFALFVLAGRRQLRVLARESEPLRLVLATIVALVAAFLVVRYPGRNEYKFLLYLMPGAAAVTAICVRELYSRHVLAGALAVLMLAMPGSHALAIRPAWTVLEPSHADGVELRANRPAPDELFQWIAANTPRDAVFLAADLRIPPLARRTLYIPVDAPWLGADGWGVARNQLVQWHIRRPDAVMYRRQWLATVVLEANWRAGDPRAIVGEIRRDIPQRPLFVHVLDPAAAARLEATVGFELKFRNAAGSVYAVTL